MGDLKVGEAFIDRAYVTMNNQAVTGLNSVSCKLTDNNGEGTNLSVTELSDGWYKASFTPLTAGVYATVWSAPPNTTVFNGNKIFKVGGGRLNDLDFEIEDAVAVVDLHTRNNMVTEVFYSGLQATCQMNEEPSDVALPSVTLPSIANSNIHNVLAGFTFRELENGNSETNQLESTQAIQIKEHVAGIFSDAISFSAGLFACSASSKTCGCTIYGNVDLSSKVLFGKTIDFQWASGYSNGTLKFNDLQTFLVINYY